VVPATKLKTVGSQLKPQMKVQSKAQPVSQPQQAAVQREREEALDTQDAG
jgi:hypothetical protein